MAQQFSSRIYGSIQGSPPYANGSGVAAFSLATTFSYAGVVSLPTVGVGFFPIAGGYAMGNGVVVYSVIQVAPSGLNVHGNQYVTDSSVATLATLANA